jgi:hypothetical protein
VTGAVLLAALAATFSKAVLAFASGVLAWRACFADSRSRRHALLAAAGCLALVYVTAAHFLVLTAGRAEPLINRAIVEPVPIADVTVGSTRLYVYPTNYAVNRRRNLAAIAQTWPVGLGPGGHAAFVAREVASGRMTGTRAWADPHSTYIGVAAELGLAGLVGFTVLAMSIALTLRRAWATILPDAPRSHRAALAAAIGALVAFAIDATVTDSMNFRHAWVALAGIAAWRPSPAAQGPHVAPGSEHLAGVTGTV